MKNIWRIAFIILLVAWILLWYFSYQKINGLEQEILNLTTETTVIEKIWDITCVWSWEKDEIKWQAICTYTWNNWWVYSWDFYNHTMNWLWKVEYNNGNIREWYFYNRAIVAWKISENNWDAIKWLWTWDEDGVHSLEMWKIFTKSNGAIRMWDFQDGELSYWMFYFNIEWIENYTLGKFNNWDIIPNDWYFITSNWCAKLSNWNAKEITRTITNTVYRNNIKLDSPLWDFYKLWSKYNPYTVQLELK